MVNRLPNTVRAQILTLLCEGNSNRAVSRIAGVNINTVYRLLVDAGEACLRYHNAVVRDLRPKQVQCDELWAMCYAYPRHLPTARAAPADAGDIWTWTALDAATKLMITWRSGSRQMDTAVPFFQDLKGRLARGHWLQLSTDRYQIYAEAIRQVFGWDLDYTQTSKKYGEVKHERGGTRSAVTSVTVKPIIGHAQNGGTSHVERQNLNIRMAVRRMSRHTNAFSKKTDRHRYMLALYFTYYNFCRTHLTLDTTPAVASGLATEPYPVEWLVTLVDQTFPRRGRQRRQPPY